MSFDAVGIISKNIKKSVEFYGLFDLVFEAYSEGHYEAKSRSGVRIMIDTEDLIKKNNPDWERVVNRQVSFGFKKETPQDVNDLYNKVINAGFENIKEPWDAFWGQRYSSVMDPDGNQIDIFAEL